MGKLHQILQSRRMPTFHVRKLEPYISPVTGRIVQSQAQRREDLKRSGCIDARETEQRGNHE